MSEGGAGDLRVRVATSLKAVPAAAWNACAHPALPEREPVGFDRENPFVSHEFLRALEESGCVGGRSGWSPAYLLVEDGEDRLLAAAPSFLKSHSQGEYVFDHSWAEAYQRAGGRYYPKIQVAAPFTPATGPRLLVASGPRAEE
ncbi:MAG: GNAT family N-acetyltransferase, partial [Beijerinckiaceae bacterium]|nr:GNAT family N-acetyltransferase [Beijerinckiaceae bacterium]